MAGPWEDYAPQAANSSGPWEDYAPKSGGATGSWDSPKGGLRGEAYDKAMNYSGADAIGGDLRGAGGIGATLLSPFDWAERAMGGQPQDRRAALEPGIKELTGANPDSMAYKTNKLLAEIGGTAGLGGVLGKAAGLVLSRFAPSIAAPVTAALESGGMTTGLNPATFGGKAANLALRGGAGAAVGYGMAGMVDPESAGTGAKIGGALPLVTGAAGMLGSGIKNAISGGGVAPEVSALAQRAKELGINIPADRLVNSRPLNAVASSLNYVPFSGRAATEDAMSSQLNQQLSKTFGQNSSNVTMALRQAGPKLGGEFDRVLKSNTVKVDPQFMQELAESANRASRELGSDGASIIGKQVDDILAKAGNGEIDGQAAYNIKKTLDRISNRNSPEAFYAGDLKKALMGALNRSLGTEQAAAFATTRQQYGNMLDLQKLAKNGAEGEVSVARLANMKDINNPRMQELADIAAQFVKAREGAHGAAQRVVLGSGAAAAGLLGGGLLGGAAAIGGVSAAGRGMNSLLNSNAARNYLLGEVQPLGLLTQGAYRAAPLLGN